MAAKCKDPVFGAMEYKRRWYKSDTIVLFDKQWEITVVAKAFSEKPITKEQRISYRYYLENQSNILHVIDESLATYINENYEIFAEFWAGARRITHSRELSTIVTPKTLLFMQNGDAVFLMDCVWDPEHGTGVQFIPSIVVGSQDIFL